MLRRRPLVRSTLELGLARGLSGAFLVVATIVLARTAGAETLGIFGLALTVGTYASVVADAGVSQYLLPKLASTPRGQWPSLWAAVVRFHRRSAIPFAVAFALLAALLTGGEERLTLLAVIPWWLLIRLNGTIRSVFVAAERTAPEASATVLEAAVTLAALAAVAVATESAPAAALTLAAGALVGLAARVHGLRRLGIGSAAPAVSPSVLVRDAAAFNAYSVLTMLYLRIDVVLLAALSTPFALGLYQPPVRFVTALMILPDALTSLLLGRVARDPDDRVTHMRQERLLAVGIPLGLLLVLVVAVGGAPALGALYGPEFREAAPALTLLTATLPLSLVANVNGNALTGRGRQGTRLACLAVAGAVAVGLGIPAIALWDITGAAAVSVVNEAVLAAGYAFALWKKAGASAVILPRARRRVGVRP